MQNTDFGVLQKSSKHFLISIFFHIGRGGHPPPSPSPRSPLRASNKGFALVYDKLRPPFHQILDPPLYSQHNQRKKWSTWPGAILAIRSGNISTHARWHNTYLYAYRHMLWISFHVECVLFKPVRICSVDCSKFLDHVLSWRGIKYGHYGRCMGTTRTYMHIGICCG